MGALRWYVDAVDRTFGIDVDYAQIVKYYSGNPTMNQNAAARYSPGHFSAAMKEVIKGQLNLKDISTSFEERATLTLDAHAAVHVVALYTVWYNWIKIRKTLRVTPAMAAGLSDKVFDMSDLAALIEQAEAPQPVNLSESDSI
jgi:hypothetical protein